VKGSTIHTLPLLNYEERKNKKMLKMFGTTYHEGFRACKMIT